MIDGGYKDCLHVEWSHRLYILLSGTYCSPLGLPPQASWAEAGPAAGQVTTPHSKCTGRPEIIAVTAEDGQPFFMFVFSFFLFFFFSSFFSFSSSVCLSACLPACLSVCLALSLSVSVYLCLRLCLSVCLSVCVCISLSLSLSVCLSLITAAAGPPIVSNFVFNTQSTSTDISGRSPSVVDHSKTKEKEERSRRSSKMQATPMRGMVPEFARVLICLSSYFGTGHFLSICLSVAALSRLTSHK